MRGQHLFLKRIAKIGVLFCITCFFLPLSSVAAQTNDRYYLQIGSFQKQSNAVGLEAKVEAQGMPAVILEKNTAAHGLLHQVLVGPFESRKEAEVAKLTLRKSGIFLEDSFVLREAEIFPKAGGEPKLPPAKPEKVERPAAPPMPAPKPAAPKVEKPAPPEPLPSAPLPQEKAPAASPAPETEEAAVPEKQPEKEAAESEVTRLEAIAFPWGDGRNLAQGSFSVAYRHSYVDYSTEITKRTEVSTSGGVVTATPISTAGLKDMDFDTSMNVDTVRLSFGLTDFFEIYGDIGMAYREFSSPQLAYGGGARINFLSIDIDEEKSIYGAVQMDYLAGELEDDYDSDDGRKWKKEADWENIDAKLELGFRQTSWRLYGGGIYGLYDESTKRTLLSAAPAPLTELYYDDELEQEHEFGGFAGLDYYFTPRFKVNLEGQAGNQNGISGHLQYDF